MNRTHQAAALALITGLLHWSCCGCEDKVTTPTVVATPTPAPTATPAATCNVRPTLPDVFRCANEPPPRFQSVVIAAQDQVRREHPEVFDGSGRVNQQVYTGWVAKTLIANGQCAIGGTDDEISIKPIGSGSQEFSELYDLVTGDGQVWNNYVSTCRPSLF